MRGIVPSLSRSVITIGDHDRPISAFLSLLIAVALKNIGNVFMFLGILLHVGKYGSFISGE